jgi:hypothetical protein
MWKRLWPGGTGTGWRIRLTGIMRRTARGLLGLNLVTTISVILDQCEPATARGGATEQNFEARISSIRGDEIGARLRRPSRDLRALSDCRIVI